MHSKIKAIFLLLLLILGESFALYYIKKYSIDNNTKYFIYSTLLYGCFA